MLENDLEVETFSFIPLYPIPWIIERTSLPVYKSPSIYFTKFNAPNFYVT
jgi:hypothetical protein